ncbi:MAG: cytochrome c biogenesis protein ResB [Elusimicrobia bacterium]|nr:cytochrome c biogenesis protein ResB [Elusimicrobiota bacterium]
MTRILRSIRFNIFLGSLIAFFAAVGTILPQLGQEPQKANAFMQAHPWWTKFFSFFGMFDLYHSWWFMSILALMAVDIVLCKLWNKPPDVGIVSLPPELTDEEDLEKHLDKKEAALKLKPFQAFFGSKMGFDDASRAARGHLRREGYHVKEEFFLPGQAGAFAATKHRIQRWGSYFAHIGLVVILIGAMIRSVFGFVEMVPVLEGGSRRMQHMFDPRSFVQRVEQLFWGHPWSMKEPVDVYVDKFTIEYYKGTMDPKLFASNARVMTGDQLLGQKIIRVNHPLDVHGVRFYQASWGAGGMFRSVTLKLGKETLKLPQRVPVKIPGTPFTVEADMMLPNFTITDGQADTASLDLKNPAVRLMFSVGPHQTSPLWLLKNYSDLCFTEDANGQLTHAPSPPFQLAGIDPILFSGIQVAYDPGFPIVVLGAIMWLLGMIALFYMHRRRIWVLLESSGSGTCRVNLGAWSSRGVREYEAEFKDLAKALRAELKSEENFKLTENPIVEVS